MELKGQLGENIQSDRNKQLAIQQQVQARHGKSVNEHELAQQQERELIEKQQRPFQQIMEIIETDCQDSIAGAVNASGHAQLLSRLALNPTADGMKGILVVKGQCDDRILPFFHLELELMSRDKVDITTHYLATIVRPNDKVRQDKGIDYGFRNFDEKGREDLQGYGLLNLTHQSIITYDDAEQIAQLIEEAYTVRSVTQVSTLFASAKER